METHYSSEARSNKANIFVVINVIYCVYYAALLRMEVIKKPIARFSTPFDYDIKHHYIVQPNTCIALKYTINSQSIQIVISGAKHL